MKKTVTLILVLFVVLFSGCLSDECLPQNLSGVVSGKTETPAAIVGKIARPAQFSLVIKKDENTSCSIVVTKQQYDKYAVGSQYP